jgi:Predicted acyl-CoA transferases/carnitine dehydratase
MLHLLNGIRVLDFTTVVLGPYATQTLADLGADVTKVEPLLGDGFRSVRPGRSNDMGAGFMNLNRNKKSIAIDVRTQEGLALVDAMVARADLVVHNMRPQSAARLGIGFERLKQVNPKIAYCYTSGFGAGGRDAAEPAYDDIIQARSGLASLNANAAGEPRFLPSIVADKVGGLHLAIGALAAYSAREARGEAVCLEIPMFEAMVSFLMAEQLAGRSFVPPLGKMGYERLQSPFRRPHRTQDGFIAVLPYTTAHWERFLGLIGRKDLAADPRVLDPVERSRNIDMLYKVLDEVMISRSAEDWLAELRRLDIPCAPINGLNEVFDDPHLADVGLFEEFTHPTEGEMIAIRSPFRAGQADADRPAPKLGGDTRSILAELGYGGEAIESLLERGIVAEHSTRIGNELLLPNSS